jgi:DNA-binding response OmpR family regulator
VTSGQLVFNTGEVRADVQILDLRAPERRLLALLTRQTGRSVPKSMIEDRFSEFDRKPPVVL